MIVDFFLGGLFDILTWVLELLPEGSINLPAGFNAFIQSLRDLDSMLPIAPMMTVIGAFVAALIPFAILRLVHWVRYFLLP